MLIALPPRDELLRLFALDKERGVLIWRRRDDALDRWNTKHAGTVAGSKNAKGYINVYVAGKIVSAHRVIFKIVHDQEPPMIDHANMNKADNRPENLRAASPSDNGANSLRRRPLPKGVTLRKATGRFLAQIRREGQHRYLGTFDSPDCAHAAYCAASAEMHGEFSRTE